ncbi:MAG TPA: hypothetical protein VMW35_12570 [Myxococcota bacterium]|jgi:hypothetical protein|nr:hypothetical protein [Myxococcota bacterium]
MTARRSAFSLVALSLLAACATPSRSAGPPGLLAVEVLSGQPSIPSWQPATPPRVEVVLDTTPSMTRTRVDGTQGLVAARAAAARTLRDLPPDTRATLHLVGGPRRGTTCSDLPGALVSESAPPAVLAADAASAPERGEDSLSASLGRLADSLEGAGETPRARIVVFSDLSSDCGEDLCAAASRLVDAGATIDWVVVGGDGLPGCLEALDGGAEPPRPIASQARSAPPRVSVTPRDAMLVGGEVAAAARVEGVGDGVAAPYPSGLAFVGIDLSPPLTVGPVAIAPDARQRLRVVDFQNASPPVREWQIDLESAAPATQDAPAQ